MESNILPEAERAAAPELRVSLWRVSFRAYHFASAPRPLSSPAFWCSFIFISPSLGIGPYYKLDMMFLSRASHLPYNVPGYSD